MNSEKKENPKLSVLSCLCFEVVVCTTLQYMCGDNLWPASLNDVNFHCPLC